jgi:hypothetical protein
MVRARAGNVSNGSLVLLQVPAAVTGRTAVLHTARGELLVVVLHFVQVAAVRAVLVVPKMVRVLGGVVVRRAGVVRHVRVLGKFVAFHVGAPTESEFLVSAPAGLNSYHRAYIFMKASCHALNITRDFTSGGGVPHFNDIGQHQGRFLVTFFMPENACRSE